MSKPTAAKQRDTFFYLESKTDDLENRGQTETSTKQDKKNLNSKIVFLQETQMITSDIRSLSKRWPGQIFRASHSTYARGIVILIHKSLPFQIINTTQDPSGRYIIVQGNIMLQKINLINVYSPNEDNPSFFEKLFLTVPALEGLYILGGDFNCALDPVLEKH